MKTQAIRSLRFALLLATGFAAHAEVRLANVFTDHMVLQRDAPLRFWGRAQAGESVSVSVDSERGKAVADSGGYWSLELPSHSAGGPFTVVVEASNKLELHDVLLGDVWVASGQSNMEMPVAGWPATNAPIFNSAAEIAAASYPQIRLLHVPKKASPYPQDDVAGTEAWAVCTPESIGTYTAVGYFFARSLWQHEHVPIGVIDSNWGGTPVEAWTPLDALAPLPELSHVIAQRATDMNAEAGIVRRNEQDKLDKAAGKIVPRRTGDRTDPWAPAALYNGMIAPLTHMSIRGVIWFQGESNAGLERARDYQGVFRAMISDWRVMWGKPQLPFLYAQLSGFNSGVGEGWPTVREAQRRALALPYTGMAVTFDLGEVQQIHFAKKQAVGERLALLARTMVYGENVVSTGPLFRSFTQEGRKLRLTFESAGGMHAAGTEPVGGFEVAGADNKFQPADARINGESVEVESREVPSPTAVRYGWRNSPNEGHANLVNGAGLPASPFTSVNP